MWTSLRRRARQRHKAGRTSLVVVAAIGLVAWSLLVVALLTKSFTSLPSSLHLSQRCRMSRMWPSYVLYRPQSPSGLDKKYRLFLYREANPGRRPDADIPRGRPALFIPGNAGSFGQMRSVASSSHHLFQSGQAGEGVGEVDWWTVDFNEDFSAFHGQTMHEQATYLNEVLSFLLLQQYPSHRTVPILGHSMGGIVARLTMLKENHPPGSVDTIITLSSPHAYPPVPLDKGVEDVYRIVNTKWRDVARSLLLVSLSGGILDNQLSSEPASLPLARLWESKTSLSAFTSSLAGLWSGVDHLAMMWCDQLRERIARGVLRIEGQEKPLHQRREEWRQMLGIEKEEEEQLDSLLSSEKQTIDQELLSSSSATTIAVSDADERLHGHFEIFTALPVGLDTSFGSPIEQRAQVRVDLCSSIEGKTTCRHVLPMAYGLYPPSTTSKGGDDFPEAEERYELPGKSIRRLRLNLKALKQTQIDTIRIDRRQTNGGSGLLLAGWTELPRTVSVASPVWDPVILSLHQVEGSVAPSRGIIVRGLDSSLLAYEVVATFSPPKTGCTPSAMPLLQIKSLATGDTQYYPSLQEGRVYLFTLHATSPYMPPAPSARSATRFSILLDECGQVAQLSLRVDWRVSAGLLMSRYRTALGAFPLASVFAVAATMWADWDERGTFPSFSSAMMDLSQLIVPLLIIASLTFSALQQLAAHFFSDDGDMSSYLQDLSFGIPTSPFFLKALLTMTLVVSAYGIVMIVAHAVDFGVYIAASACDLLRARKERPRNKDDNAFVGRPKATLLSLGLLIVAIWLAVPVQFVFLVLTLIQMNTSLRATQDATFDSKEGSAANDYANQQKLLLNIYLWLLPFNAPALLIWARNLLRGYFGLLSGPDHNVLAVIGFLCVSQISSTERVLQRVDSKLASGITSLLFLSFSAFSLAYGIRYTYILFSYANVVLLWLAARHYHKQYIVSKGRRREGDTATYTPVQDDDTVESLTLKAEISTSYSNAPQEVLEDVRVPESIQASMKESVGYTIEKSETEKTSTVKEGRDALLERYLDLLDEYFACKQRISTEFSHGSFQLSKAKMQLGRVTSMNELWDGRMKARLIVEVSTENDTLHLTSRLPKSQEDDDSNSAIIIERKEPSTQLRKRVLGKENIEHITDSNLAPLMDEKTEKKAALLQGGEKETQNGKRAAQPFDPLYQFAAFPPPSLRKAQSDFTEGLRLLVGVQGNRGLLQIQEEMARLEEELKLS